MIKILHSDYLYQKLWNYIKIGNILAVRYEGMTMKMKDTHCLEPTYSKELGEFIYRIEEVFDSCWKILLKLMKIWLPWKHLVKGEFVD